MKQDKKNEDLAEKIVFEICKLFKSTSFHRPPLVALLYLVERDSISAKCVLFMIMKPNILDSRKIALFSGR